MDTRLQALAGSQNGTFCATEALAAGVSAVELHRAVRAGDLIRVRRQAYVSAQVWQGADDAERYRLTCLAVARTRPGDALSHHAAIAVHGLPLWGYDAGRVDFAASVRQGVRRGRIWLHPGERVETAEVGGLRVVSPARAIVRAALTMGRDCAVVAGDAGLHRGLVTAEDCVPRWPG